MTIQERRLTGRLMSVAICLLMAAGFSSDAAGQNNPEKKPAPYRYPNECDPTISPKIPTTVFPILEQYPANCFSWDSFFALNWPAMGAGVPDTKKKLGEPGPVVWETYRDSDTVFLPDGAEPKPWGADFDLQNVHGRILKQPAKSRPGVPHLHLVNEAAPTVDSWLIARNGTVTLFEKLVNKTEFDYILSNGFYSAANQHAAMGSDKKGVNQPAGSIEIKAAWMQLTKEANPDWSIFLTTKAMIPSKFPVVPAGEPNATPFVEATMGLVAIHIIHKLPNAPQYIWSTFEHKDNCPDATDENVDRDYNYYNPKFQLQNFNLAPLKNPNQVKRVTKLPGIVTQINAKAHAAVRKYEETENVKTPFANYILVNTQWPSDAVVVPPAARAPLPNGNMIPRTLLNTMLETYVQDKYISCIDCHVGATIANDRNGNPSSFGSDYSFLYGLAQWPKKAE